MRGAKKIMLLGNSTTLWRARDGTLLVTSGAVTPDMDGFIVNKAALRTGGANEFFRQAHELVTRETEIRRVLEGRSPETAAKTKASPIDPTNNQKGALHAMREPRQVMRLGNNTGLFHSSGSYLVAYRVSAMCGVSVKDAELRTGGIDELFRQAHELMEREAEIRRVVAGESPEEAVQNAKTNPTNNQGESKVMANTVNRTLYSYVVFIPPKGTADADIITQDQRIANTDEHLQSLVFRDIKLTEEQESAFQRGEVLLRIANRFNLGTQEI